MPTSRGKLPYGLTLKLAYSMIIPVGHYDPHVVYTAGHNVTYYIPNIAFSYLTRPNFLGDGLEISGHAFFDISSYNKATRYQSGTVYDLDFGVSERKGPLQFGIAGYYARQFDDDIRNDTIVSPSGKKLAQFYLGPIIAFDVPKLHGTFKLKVNLPVEVENGLNAKRVFLSYAFKL